MKPDSCRTEKYKSSLALSAVPLLTKMEAMRSLIPLVLLIVSCLAEFNLTQSEGKKLNLFFNQNRETSFQEASAQSF